MRNLIGHSCPTVNTACVEFPVGISFEKKKVKYGKSSEILNFLVHTVMIRFSARGAYLLLISKGRALIRNGALLRDTAL